MDLIGKEHGITKYFPSTYRGGGGGGGSGPAKILTTIITHHTDCGVSIYSHTICTIRRVIVTDKDRISTASFMPVEYKNCCSPVKLNNNRNKNKFSVIRQS
jgi:hypothetical protein